MKVKYIGKENFIQQTWKNENQKGKLITIQQGDIFNTSNWGGVGSGICESVVTDNNEWICDVDCKEFNDLFKILI